MGFFGAFIVVSLAVSKEVNDPRFAGMSTSLANMGLFFGGAVIPVFFGSLIDRYQGAADGFSLYHAPDVYKRQTQARMALGPMPLNRLYQWGLSGSAASTALVPPKWLKAVTTPMIRPA